MASGDENDMLGADISKDSIDIYDGESDLHIENNERAIRCYIRQLPGAARFAVEPTGSYHAVLMHLALEAGHTVYLVDPYKVSRYRDAVGGRVKTDKSDARLLHRYLAAEGPRLTPYQPAPKATKRLADLLRARAKLVKSRVAISQSLQGIGELAKTRISLLTRLERAFALIDKKIELTVKQADLSADYERCKSIPGVGILNAAALVAIFHRGAFNKADAYIAYLGLDVRVRESGRYRGKRKLTKKGNPEVRRLLFNAARSGARSACWRPYYDALRQRGLSATAAYVALSRKIAKVAFALMRDKKEYQLMAN